jgi:hypothetical protein
MNVGSMPKTLIIFLIYIYIYITHIIYIYIKYIYIVIIKFKKYNKIIVYKYLNKFYIDR